eukprot:jgi/Astpho2/10006/fgenesh1_pg.00153_%23_23_t
MQGLICSRCYRNGGSFAGVMPASHVLDMAPAFRLCPNWTEHHHHVDRTATMLCELQNFFLQGGKGTAIAAWRAAPSWAAAESTPSKLLMDCVYQPLRLGYHCLRSGQVALHGLFTVQLGLQLRWAACRLPRAAAVPPAGPRQAEHLDQRPGHSTGRASAPAHIQKALQPQQESLDGSLRSPMLWQQKITQAVIAQAQDRLRVLAATWTGSVAGRLSERGIQRIESVGDLWCNSWTPRYGIKHQSVNMQELESIHNLCSGALPLVVEGQEVFAQQMELRLQLTLQLAVMETAMGAGHFCRGPWPARHGPAGWLTSQRGEELHPTQALSGAQPVRATRRLPSINVGVVPVAAVGGAGRGTQLALTSTQYPASLLPSSTGSRTAETQSLIPCMARNRESSLQNLGGVPAVCAHRSSAQGAAGCCLSTQSHCLQRWWLDSGHTALHQQLPESTQRCYEAAEAGDLQFLQSRAHHLDERMRWQISCCAAREGHLEVLQWFRQQGIALKPKESTNPGLVRGGRSKPPDRPSSMVYRGSSRGPRGCAPVGPRAGLSLGVQHVRGCSRRGPPGSAPVGMGAGLPHGRGNLFSCRRQWTLGGTEMGTPPRLCLKRKHMRVGSRRRPAGNAAVCPPERL